jgi:hypothetical protein
VKVADVDAHERPVYADGSLFFTTLPRHERRGRTEVSIRRLVLDGLDVVDVLTVRERANGANGMTLAPDGRLLVCEQGLARRGRANQRRRPERGAPPSSDSTAARRTGHRPAARLRLFSKRP